MPFSRTFVPRVLSRLVEDPVTLDEAKAHLRVVIDEEDDLIEGFIRSARDFCEKSTERALVPTQFEYALPGWPCSGRLYLPKAPISSVDSVIYTATDGTEIDLDASLWRLIQDPDAPFLVSTTSNGSFPTVATADDAVRVRFTAGYDPTPYGLKMAVLLMVGHFDRSREAVLPNNASAANFAVDSLLSQFKNLDERWLWQECT